MSSPAPVRRLVRAVKFGTDWRKKVPKQADMTISPQIQTLLSRPTWSVKSLLPTETSANVTGQTGEISREKLHHLLRLSALPKPKTPEQEEKMLQTLQSQIHFVKEVQKVNTTGVEPLQAIRDETEAGIQEQTVTLKDLKPYFDREEKVGRNGTIRRKKDEGHEQSKKMTWDAFQLGAGSESRKAGKYFFVKRQTPAKEVKASSIEKG